MQEQSSGGISTTQVSKSPAPLGESPKEYQQKKVIFRTYQVIWYILGIVEVLLAFRVILKMLGANPASTFVSLVYSLTNPLSTPFAGIFRISTTTQGSVFEWSTLVGMFVYGLVAYGLVKLFQLIKPASPREVEETVDSQ